MPKEFRYVFDDWEDELLGIAHEAIECAIASAYMNVSGVEFLSKVASRLAKFATASSKAIIRVILSDQFAPTKLEKMKILKSMSVLPGVDVRIYCGVGFQHRKNYIFRTEDEIRAVVGSVNATSAGLFKNLEVAAFAVHENSDPEAKKIMGEFETIWSRSKVTDDYIEVNELLNSAPRFSEGENVRYISTGKIGTINRVIEGSRGYSYRVTLEGRMCTVAERFLEAVQDAEEGVIENFWEGIFGSHLDYRLFQTWFRLAKPIEDNLYSYLGSKTVFNPHQFKPLLRFLSPSSDERLFIADEVGVGKTIEAGIILTELIARGRLNYRTPILIVCPNSLGPKWVDEMKKRFGLRFYFHDGDSLGYMLKTTLQDGIFPKEYIFSVVSLQLLRRIEYLNLIKELDARRESSIFGMVIIDEAHHMRNQETDNNELGNLLSGITEMMLMLSATPLNLRNEDLFNQMHILNPILFPDITTFETLQSPVIKLNKIRRLLAAHSLEAVEQIFDQLAELGRDAIGKLVLSHPQVKELIEKLKNKTPLCFDEIVRYERLFVSLSPLYYSFTRTRKREALEHQVQREVWELPISLSDEERKFSDDVLNTIRDYYFSEGKDPHVISFIINTHLRMVSSCIPAMKEYLEWCVRENRMITYGDEASGELDDDEQIDTVNIDKNLKNKFSGLLIDVQKIEGSDSKYIQFRQMLKKIVESSGNQQVMVFSFFIRTLKYLKRRLEADGFSVGLICGEVPLQGDKGVLGRYEIMDEFKKGTYQILLSSEVGGEGLDFQYCHALINYDLPYNPMRIEQRIGRVDRFGQEADKIIVANLFIRGTVDEEIYDRLYRRIHLVEEGIGALEPILGKELSDIQTAIITGGLTTEQKEEFSQRIARAVAAAKSEMEEFEKYRRELISDDYLAQPINSIGSGNFVSPDDAIQLTEQGLSGLKKCEFIKIGNNWGEIVLSEDMIDRGEQFCRRPGNEAGYGELQPLFSGKRVKVVFDGSIAESKPDHIFLSPTGFWTRFLTSELEQKKALFKIFSFGVKHGIVDFLDGEYIVFLFEVRIEGVRTEIEFIGVPVGISAKSVAETSFEVLPRVLANADTFEVPFSREDIDPNTYLDVARKHLEQVLETKRKVSSEENLYKVESRIAALTKANDIKIKKLQQQMESHISKRSGENREPEERYLRLTNARIEKEKICLKSKIDELRKCQDLSLDYNLEAIIYLKVGDGQNV